jgi:hypothetical protein
MADKYRYRFEKYMAVPSDNRQQDMDDLNAWLELMGADGWRVFEMKECRIPGKICFLFWMSNDKL